MTNQLVYNDQVIHSLGEAISQGMAYIPNVPGLLTAVIRDEMWRERIVRQTGEVARFASFEAFVTAYPPEGLGTTVKVLEEICKQHGPDVVPLLLGEKSALNPNGTNRHTDTSSPDNIRASQQSYGTDSDYILARLKRDAPDLATRVIAGELSAHAAAIEAGFAKPKVSVSLVDMRSAARTLCGKLDSDQVLELIDRLHNELAGR